MKASSLAAQPPAPTPTPLGSVRDRRRPPARGASLPSPCRPLGSPCTLPPQWPKRCACSLIAQRPTGSAARPRATVHWSLVESLLTSRHSAHGVGAEGRERDESKGGERECETERESWSAAADRNSPRPLAFAAPRVDPLGTWPPRDPGGSPPTRPAPRRWLCSPSPRRLAVTLGSGGTRRQPLSPVAGKWRPSLPQSCEIMRVWKFVPLWRTSALCDLWLSGLVSPEVAQLANRSCREPCSFRPQPQTLEQSCQALKSRGSQTWLAFKTRHLP